MSSGRRLDWREEMSHSKSRALVVLSRSHGDWTAKQRTNWARLRNSSRSSVSGPKSEGESGLVSEVPGR